MRVSLALRLWPLPPWPMSTSGCAPLARSGCQTTPGIAFPRRSMVKSRSHTAALRLPSSVQRRFGIVTPPPSLVDSSFDFYACGRDDLLPLLDLLLDLRGELLRRGDQDVGTHIQYALADVGQPDDSRRLIVD